MVAIKWWTFLTSIIFVQQGIQNLLYTPKDQIKEEKWEIETDVYFN